MKIRNPEVNELIEALTKFTGGSKTRAVIGALRERLARERRRRDRQRLIAEMLEIGRRCAAHGIRDRTPHGEVLYDGWGLPARES